MESILHITNGDSAADLLREAGLEGVVLPWRDVLHEGPVPAGLDLAALSRLRAEFLAGSGWGVADELHADFIERDRQLAAAGDFHRVVLWFEHDLYDQLQVLQLLDWFAHPDNRHPSLSMICTDRYLGWLTPGEVPDMWQHERRVTRPQLDLAQRAWAAFRAPEPGLWQSLLDVDTGVLPFLDGAVRRLIEEYPDCRSGLSRTARTALALIEGGFDHPGRLFARYQETEERQFLGDLSFWAVLEELGASTPPLLRAEAGGGLSPPFSPSSRVALTQAGIDTLHARRHWLDSHSLDRWIGGVHLLPGSTWCRSAQTGRLVRG